MRQRTHQGSRRSKHGRHRCRCMGRPPMRWAWRAWTVDESRNRQRKTTRQVEQTPVVICRAERWVAENLTLKRRPPIRPSRRRKLPPIEWGGGTTSWIRVTPHGKGRGVKAFGVKARGMQKMRNPRRLIWRGTRSASGWEAANRDWNSRSTPKRRWIPPSIGVQRANGPRGEQGAG
jgi:hypothetical protein